jgi:hypothetical protein
MAFGNATKGYVKKHSGGGGGGGTSNYNNLSNKPQINGVELTGNKTSEQLNIGGVSFKDGVINNELHTVTLSNLEKIAFVFFKNGTNNYSFTVSKNQLDVIGDGVIRFAYVDSSGSNKTIQVNVVKSDNTYTLTVLYNGIETLINCLYI